MTSFVEAHTAIVRVAILVGISMSGGMACNTEPPILGDSTQALEVNYNFGIFSRDIDIDELAVISGYGSHTVVLAYDYDGHDWDNYLDECEAQGLGCIVSVKNLTVDHSIPIEDRIDDVTAVVNATKNHPAVAGYYTFDEPKAQENAPQEVAAVYAAVKALTSLPIYVSFAGGRVQYINTFVDSMTSAPSYDVGFLNNYRMHNDMQEFVSTNPAFDGNEEKKTGWGVGAFAKYVEVALSEAEQVGADKFLIAPQAMGAGFNRLFRDKRLPTPKEMRFTMYFPLVHEVNGRYGDGLMVYGHHTAVATTADTVAPAPYEGDGKAWLAEVYAPLASEFSQYIPALAGGVMLPRSISGVSEGYSDIQSALFKKNGTERWVIATNGPTSGTDNTAWGVTRVVDFTLGSNLDNFYNAASIENDLLPYRNGRAAFIDRDEKFRDILTRFQVGVYKLKKASSFNFVNRASDHALRPVDPGSMHEGDQVVHHTQVRTWSSQKWMMQFRQTSGGKHYYNIVSRHNKSYCLRPHSTAPGAWLRLGDYNSTTKHNHNTQWEIVKSDGYLLSYHLRNRASGYYLEVSNTSENGVVKQMPFDANGKKQMWQMWDYD